MDYTKKHTKRQIIKNLKEFFAYIIDKDSSDAERLHYAKCITGYLNIQGDFTPQNKHTRHIDRLNKMIEDEQIQKQKEDERMRQVRQRLGWGEYSHRHKALAAT